MEQPSAAGAPATGFRSRMQIEMKRQMGSVPASGDWVVLNVLAAMVLLLIQFGLGMWVNLFVGIPEHHPGAGATNFFSGVFHSVSWAIVHGPVPLAIHAALGVLLSVGIVHGILWNRKWGTRGTLWATIIGALFIVAAGFSGGAFLTYNKDVSSLLMALFFGAAMLCYTILIRLLLRSPEVGRTPRSTRPRP